MIPAHSRFPAFAILGILFVIGFGPTICLADSSETPAAACPAPKVQTKGWPPVTLSRMGVRLRMPKRFAEKEWAVTIGDPLMATYRAGHLESFTLEIMVSSGQPLSQQKTIRQSDYSGYTECTEAIDGHSAIIQSFRGGGVFMLGDRSFPPFSVMAVYDVGSGRILTFHGSSATRQAQEDLLAILRTVQFTR